GGTPNGADAGQTGGDTLLFSSPTIAAGQLFDRVGVHWVAARGTQDTFYVELRTSADSVNWSDWALLGADEDMVNTDTNEWYASPQLAVDNARYAEYRVWLTDGNPSDVQRVGLTFMDVNDLNAGPVVRLVNDIVGAAKDVARSFTEPAAAGAAAINPTRILARSDWAADEKLMQWIPKYPQKVQKAVVHHTVTDAGDGRVDREPHRREVHAVRRPALRSRSVRAPGAGAGRDVGERHLEPAERPGSPRLQLHPEPVRRADGLPG